MKKILYILLFCIIFIDVKSQSLMTVGEIYDFNIGDVFITVEYYNNYFPPTTYNKTVITNKYFSASFDTVYYVGNYYSFVPEYSSSHSSFGNIFYYSNLNDTIGAGLGTKLNNFSCIDTNGYTGTWLDTIYYNENYCNVLTSKIIKFDNGFTLIDTCWTYFEPFWGSYEYGKGLGMTDFYYNDCANGQSNCARHKTLIYFLKGTDTCGSSPYLTSIDKYEIKNNTVNISPNPFSSQTTITFNEEQKDITIKIIDVLGKEKKSIDFNGFSLTFEKGELLEGVYFLKVFDNGKMFTKKVIIQ